MYIATSLDGYVAGPTDEIEWLNRYNNVDYGLKEFLSGIGAIIMGRRSYDIGVEQKWFSQFNLYTYMIIVDKIRYYIWYKTNVNQICKFTIYINS